MLTYEQKLDRDSAWALLEGSMHFEERSAVHTTLRSLTQALNDLGVDYAVAGSMAMFLHGFRRFTEDVDVLVTREGLAKIHEALEGRGYIKPFAASKNLRDARTGVKIDFLISGQYPGDGKPGPIAFPVPREASVDRDGIRVLSIPKWTELKLISGRLPARRRDWADVQDAIRTLNLSREFADQLDASLRDAYFQLWDELQTDPGDH
ncbi:MAG: hypothetical protein L0228_21255 [Planctomycetes bacterium]|nr:hypothetical protein [Planctomycetota bacterium]